MGLFSNEYVLNPRTIVISVLSDYRSTFFLLYQAASRKTVHGFHKVPTQMEDRNKWLLKMHISTLHYSMKPVEIYPKTKWLKTGTLGPCVLWLNPGSATYWLGDLCFYALVNSFENKESHISLMGLVWIQYDSTYPQSLEECLIYTYDSSYHSSPYYCYCCCCYYCDFYVASLSGQISVNNSQHESKRKGAQTKSCPNVYAFSLVAIIRDFRRVVISDSSL